MNVFTEAEKLYIKTICERLGVVQQEISIFNLIKMLNEEYGGIVQESKELMKGQIVAMENPAWVKVKEGLIVIGDGKWGNKVQEAAWTSWCGKSLGSLDVKKFFHRLAEMADEGISSY